MADLLLPALIQIVKQKATDSLVQQIANIWGVDDQRERLKDVLLAVEAVMADAENKGASNPAVKNWMLKLKSAAYDADDVLDEFCYEELRQDAVKRGNKVGNNVSDFLSLNNPALFRYKMCRKLKKVVGRIEQIVADMGKFGFIQGQHVEVVSRVKTDSLLVESNVLGRDDDKEKIVKLLLEGSQCANLAVVPIVGMGGLGKTTLAQLVFDDPRVKAHFKLQSWVCVSEEVAINVLVRSIIDGVIHKDCKIPVDNMELLKTRLHQELGEKRYLLVLDDVWNEDAGDWERLRGILNCGDSGSAVVVTTRSDRVSLIMRTMTSYNLKCLSEDDSWELFKERAFRMGVMECPKLIEIGKELAKRCRGLPLAIKTLSSLMSYNHTEREWSFILNKKNIWEDLATKNDVLPVLRLSYDHLLPHMKQCFAFCAVYPKDYEINKMELIQFWMANGFIPSSEPGSLEMKGNNTFNDSLEMKGNDIFNELSWRSFFQEVTNFVPVSSRTFRYGLEDGYPSQTKCKMHDFMHDLAQEVSGGECLSQLEVPIQQNKSNINVRHISLNDTIDINKIMACFPSTRSLISSNYFFSYVKNIGFLMPNSLRILKLYQISTLVTPQRMKHLRYLEISSTAIESLPEAISNLYFLQTLRLSVCFSLKKLPEGMRYMSELRHLYIEECFSLKSMPPGLGQLSGLQKLTTYVVGVDAGNSIAELTNLNLYGTLHIYNLREVRDVADAREANLVAKKNLDDLLLCWGTPAEYDNIRYMKKKSNSLKVNHWDPFEVLDALSPYNRLKVLSVAFYEGDKFPVWTKEYHILENLIELRIMECRECTNIAPVERLPLLQILELNHLDKLRHLCNNASTSAECGDGQIVFPSLEQLLLSNMANLCCWCKGEASGVTSLAFPKLKRLEIDNCPKLIARPIVPLLQKLSVSRNKALSCFAVGLTTLQKLELSLGSRDGETEGTTDSLSFQPWESLEDLKLTRYNGIVPIVGSEDEASATVMKCRSLTLVSCNIFMSHIPSHSSLWFWKCFTFLERLNIWNCDSLTYWPEEEFASLNSLSRIWVDGCQKFLGSQQETQVGKSITKMLLPKLQDLEIRECADLIEVPKISTSIRNLNITSCPKLEGLPEWLGSMVALKWLLIEECKSLSSLSLSTGGLTSLAMLQIYGCPNLTNLPEGMEGLQALKKLEIKRCPKIRVLPAGLLQQLKNLDRLWIEGCPHLEWHFRMFGKYRHLISEIPLAKIGDERSFGIFRDLLALVPSHRVTCFSSQS